MTIPRLSVYFLFLGALVFLQTGCAARTEPSSPTAVTAKPAAVTPAPPAAAAPAAPPQSAATPAKPAEQYELLPAAVANPPAPFEGEGWRDMFDGDTLAGWRPTLFAGRAEVECRRGVILLNMGDPFTGVNYTNPFPNMNYEVALDAMRVMGSDFFCGLTVPVNDTFCSLIVGGWGGGLVGISSLDGMDASENETTKFMNFEKGRWYRIRLRVTENRIEGWIDDEKIINVSTRDRKISLRPGDIEMSKPMGIASWQTASAIRAVKVRTVTGPAGPGPR